MSGHAVGIEFAVAVSLHMLLRTSCNGVSRIDSVVCVIFGHPGSIVCVLGVAGESCNREIASCEATHTELHAGSTVRCILLPSLFFAMC